MYPTDIYDWSNDPNDYDFDNNDYHGGDAYQGRNRAQGSLSGHDKMINSGEYAALTYFQRFKIRKRLFSPCWKTTIIAKLSLAKFRI